MADNPRIPGHPSDIPSSRAPGNLSGGATPPPIYTPPPIFPTGHNNQMRNILIGAIVTVISSTIIYYLTVYQNRGKADEANIYKVKEATIEAWDSYMAYENIYTKNTLLLDSGIIDPAQLFSEVKKESEKFLKDVEDLKKTKNIDRDLVKALDRRIENENTLLPQFEAYIKKITTLRNSNLPMDKKIQDQAAEMTRWLTHYRGMYDRAVNHISEIAKVLSDRYRHAFSIQEFELIKKTPQKLRELDSIIAILQNTTVDSSGNIIMGIVFARNVKPASIVGHWHTEDMDVMIEENGKVSWTTGNGGETTGTWKIVDDKMEVNAIIHPDSTRVDWRFRLAYIRPNSFTLANDEPPFEIYKMIRKTPD